MASHLQHKPSRQCRVLLCSESAQCFNSFGIFTKSWWPHHICTCIKPKLINKEVVIFILKRQMCVYYPCTDKSNKAMKDRLDTLVGTSGLQTQLLPNANESCQLPPASLLSGLFNKAEIPMSSPPLRSQVGSWYFHLFPFFFHQNDPRLHHLDCLYALGCR